MVNLNKIKVIKRENGALVLEMDTNPEVIVPVSKTYSQHVIESFSNVQ